MLRTLRPNARIANTLRWEGIVIDPLGALFAVLIYEAILSYQEGHTAGVLMAGGASSPPACPRLSAGAISPSATAATVLLFGIDEKGKLRAASAKRLLEPKAGRVVIALTPSTAP